MHQTGRVRAVVVHGQRCTAITRHATGAVGTTTSHRDIRRDERVQIKRVDDDTQSQRDRPIAVTRLQTQA